MNIGTRIASLGHVNDEASIGVSIASLGQLGGGLTNVISGTGSSGLSIMIAEKIAHDDDKVLEEIMKLFASEIGKNA